MGRETEEVRRFRVVEADELLNWAKKDMDVVRGRLVQEREREKRLVRVDISLVGRGEVL